MARLSRTAGVVAYMPLSSYKVLSCAVGCARVGLVWLKDDVLKVMCQLAKLAHMFMCQLMRSHVQLCTEWIVIIQFSDFRFALFVFALLFCDCCTFAWLRT